MPPQTDRALVLFPGAIGDFLCFLPTLVALRARHCGTLLLCAKPELLTLIRWPDTVTASIDRHEVADVFVSGSPASLAARQLFGGYDWVYSWTGFGNPHVAQRLADLTGGSIHVYRFRGMQAGEHAVDYFARCAGVTPCFPVDAFIADDAAGCEEFARHHRLAGPYLVVHAGSGSAKKNWLGFTTAVHECRHRFGIPSVLLQGPAEVEVGQRNCGADVVASRLSLSQVAALLRRSRCYVGNDSGISHLAGVTGAAGVVLFGPTDPATWAPRSNRVQSLHAPNPCLRCGPDVFCVHRLAVSAVVDAIGAVLNASGGAMV